MKNRDEFVSSVPADKVFRIYRETKLFGKGTDIFVSLVMSQIVVDDPQVIQIKYTDGCTLFFSERVRFRVQLRIRSSRPEIP